MGFVAEVLKKNYGLRPLEQEEFERYCFFDQASRKNLIISSSPECPHWHRGQALHSPNFDD